MTIARDDFGYYFDDDSASVTAVVDTSPKGNRKLVAIVQYLQQATVPNFTVKLLDGGAGRAFTAAYAPTYSSFNDGGTYWYLRSSVYYLDAPPPNQACSVQVTTSATVDWLNIGVWALSDAEQGALDDTDYVYDGDENVPSLSRTMTGVTTRSISLSGIIGLKKAESYDPTGDNGLVVDTTNADNPGHLLVPVFGYGHEDLSASGDNSFGWSLDDADEYRAGRMVACNIGEELFTGKKYFIGSPLT